MNSTADSQNSAPSSEEDRVQSLDARFGAIEHEQAEQRSILETIAAKISGSGSSGSVSRPASAAAPASDPGDMAEQMRQAVRDVRAEEAAAEHERQHTAAHEQMSRPAPEQPPREVMVKGKQRLQRTLFGGDR